MHIIGSQIFLNFDEACVLWRGYHKEITIAEIRISALHALIISILVNLSWFGKDDPDINNIIKSEISNKIEIDHELHNEQELLDKFELMHSENHHISIDILKSILNGQHTLCPSAIMMVWKVSLKLFERIKISLQDLKVSPQDSKRNKNLLYHSNMLAKWFDLMYGAWLEDPKDIFYQEEPNNEILAIVDIMEYHEPINPKEQVEHINNIQNGSRYKIAIGSKAIMRNNTFWMFTTAAFYACYYKFASQTCIDQANFSLTMPRQKALEKVFEMRKASSAAKASKITDIKTHDIIYIPINEEDVLTLDNLDSTALPKMYEEEIECGFEVNLENYDKNSYVWTRIITDIDGWELPSVQALEDTVKEVNTIFEVEAIVIDLHGGGFMFGSSNKQLKYSTYFAKHTGYPNFTIDYKLAPDHKFPAAISDWWQVYLWLIKYSETYLNLRFNKVILSGHSAGANLALGVMSLWIQKNVRKPDGLMLIYPPMTWTLDSFSPSILMSLEDMQLNASLLHQIQALYIPESFSNHDHYLLSPKFLPDEMVAKFPPVRILVGGMDPLRDEAIRFTAKLLKNGINVKILEYRYCVHGFMNHIKSPYLLDECKDTKQRVWDFMIEMIDLSEKFSKE